MSNFGSSYKWDEWFGARRLETLRAHAPRVFPFKVSPARSEQLKQISKIIDKSKAIEAMEGSKYLLFWTKEHNYSTVSKTAIKSTNPGDRTEGKFMGKWYPCIVIGSKFCFLSLVLFYIIVVSSIYTQRYQDSLNRSW